MADRTIKPDDNNDLVLQNNDGSAKLELNEDQTVKVTTGSDAGEDFTVNTSQLIVEGDTGHIGINTTSVLLGYSNQKLSIYGTGVFEYPSMVLALNRTSSDGRVMDIYGQGNLEGNISVSGSTVSYNPFTGSHYGWINGSCEKGKVVIMTGTNQHAYNNTDKEIIYGIEECSTENDSRFLGSYFSVLEPNHEKTIGDEDNSPNPDLIMSVGNGVMWVVDEGSNITQGDNLITSTTQGHARKDPQTATYSYVIGRAGEPVDWSEVNETVGGKKHKLISVLYDISTVKN